MEIPAMAAATAALEQPATVFVALELSKARWLVGIHSPIADGITRHSIAGGDSRAPIGLIVRARRRAEARLEPYWVLRRRIRLAPYAARAVSSRVA